jgi:glycosyltransferase involved in cell wall biosynthesis
MTNQDILVTVGMPVHNGAFYLVTALESIREQTHQNLQVLVFDDGSTDGSGELARAFPDARLEVLAGRERAGVGAARQRLKTAAAGDYLVWCDADDVFEPENECVAELLREGGGRRVLVCLEEAVDVTGQGGQ